MTTVRDVLSCLSSFAPVETKMDFDNVGLLVGHGGGAVTKVLLALDVTEGVIREAADMGAELIVSHHPVFFDRKDVTDGDPAGARILALAEARIAAICMHTNLDAAAGGVNDALAAALGLAEIELLQTDGIGPDGKIYGIGRIGCTAPTAMSAFVPAVQKALKAPGIRFWDAGRPVEKVAVVGGSGGSDLAAAAGCGCDTLVTGEIKYHQWLDGREMGLNLVEAGHFCTENPVLLPVSALLRTRFPDLTVKTSEIHGPTARFFVASNDCACERTGI